MPRGVGDALQAYADTWRERGIRAWEEGWFELPTEVGNVLADILDAAPGSVSMHENVSVAQALALSTVDFVPPRNRLVCTSADFPSVLYLYEGLARRGAEVIRVGESSGLEVDEQQIIEAIDERTAVVALSHVLFRTARLVDLEPILQRARDVGALTLVDAYQSVGTVPFSVRQLSIDMLTGGSVKWLCGGPGAGYLYVRPELAGSLRPAITGWMAHEAPFDFDSSPVRPHDGARRFWTGTPAIPAYMAARPGYDIIVQIGVQAIREKSLRQTERLIALADEAGFPLVSPRDPGRRGGTVVIDVPNAASVCASLIAEDVLVDFRPGVGMRLAPHFYTRDDEVEEVVARLRAHAATA
jgi:kynureninase